MKRKFKKILLIMIPCFFMLFVSPVNAMPVEPDDLPQNLKGGFPHDPEVAHYYLAKLVVDGKLTEEEKEKIEVYMIFRYARFKQDIAETEGMTEKEFIQHMTAKQKIRENPLKEFADYCGFTLQRAREIMNLVHDSDKGNKYYNQYKG
jgi:hypothetical protein